MTDDCPKCGKYTFNVSIMDFIGRCSNCTHEEEIDKDTWNLKYDDGYKTLRATLKYNAQERDNLIKKFKLTNPMSYHSKFLLTPSVLKVIEKDAPNIFKQLIYAK